MEGTYLRLINHAIGALGDLDSDLVRIRKELHRIKGKSTWTDKELKSLYESLIDIAFKCNSTLEEWEEKTFCYIQHPQGGRNDGS